MTGRDSFLGLRHYSPESVRNLRLALDLGIAPAELKRTCAGEHAERLRSAIDYMAAHPGAGAVNWDGMLYDWKNQEVP